MIKTDVKGLSRAKSDIKAAFKAMQLEGSVTIGIHEGAGIHTKSAKEGDPKPVAQIGAYHQFGNGKEKGWLTIGVDKAVPEMARYLKKVQKKVNKGAVFYQDDILNAMGLMGQNNVKLYMTEIDLIDTGELKNSVTWEISETNAEVGL